MKIKLTGVIIILSGLIISCDSDVQEVNNELLTSTVWVDQSPPETGSKWPEPHHIFHKNGDYTLEFSEVMKITGQWKWVNKNEIYVEFKSMNLANNKHVNLTGGQNYNIRIVDISEGKLKILKKFETDAWDSGFAKENTFKAI